MTEQLILKGSLEGHSGWVTSLATSLENPNMLLSGSRDKSLIIWNLTRDDTSYGYPKRSLHGHSHIVSDCVISSDGAYALSASWDRTLRLWELSTGTTTRRFVGHTNDVLSVSFSADNRQIVSGSRDRTIKLWNTLGDCKFTINEKGHSDWVSCVRFSPNPQNPVIVSCGWDKLVKVWELSSCRLQTDHIGHTGYINTVTISPDGSLCASGGKDGTTMLWDLNESKHLYSLNAGDEIHALVFSPNRYWLCAATSSSIIIFDLEKKSKVDELKPEFQTVGKKSREPECVSLAWSADDSNCESFLSAESPPVTQHNGNFQKPVGASKPSVSSFFQTPAAKRAVSNITPKVETSSLKLQSNGTLNITPTQLQRKRSFDDVASDFTVKEEAEASEFASAGPALKKSKINALQKAAPLAERMRPQTLDDVFGQELVGEQGILRSLIEQDRVPSMILWGGPGTGKTTIARCIASMVGSRFVEINSTSSGVADCKKIFTEARGELGLTGRKTIVFCDEIHRFSKSQQDVFLGPVESGQVTLIAASTENPSFKVQNALLSRCRVFTLQKLTDDDILRILERALVTEGPNYSPSDLVDTELLKYLSAFADGDARTALNLLELAMGLSTTSTTKEEIKSSLTKTLVYDRAGDQHYDTISAFHKSVRGSDPDAALYYLARMLQSGEDPLYIARRMVVIASEDVGLADNSMITLTTSAYTAAEKIGMPECRISLAHATVALCLAPKSTRAYRGLNNAYAALREPGVAGLPIPIHLRNAPTKLMKELGYGDQYKYNPNYKEGKVVQEYLPEQLQGRRFLEDRDLGTEIDPGAWP
ncbi:hypothetical protein B7494_g1610 [Chlorociboria aeruginascens]|nr:hypothetical protein B7494_g1610 [Chlorociboria aeruginascens]